MLSPMNGGYRCANGHSFDIAREGYINLLRTKSTGDSAQMLRARRAFLERGHFAPLAEAVCEVVDADFARYPVDGREDFRSTVNTAERAGILDSGCGEGYYLGRLQAYLNARPDRHGFRLWGLDSSGDAIRMAARRYREASFVVADCKDMIPFADSSFAVAICIFAPRNPAEFARVLAPGGLLLIVVPEPDHLGELRETLDLLGMEDDKLRHLYDSLDGLFGEPTVRTVRYAMDLSADDVALLVTMSPSHRHQPEERLASIRRDAHYGTTAAFTLVTCRRQ
jgi:23S rRNA (guanine745-N1)-methyltransferase